MTKEEKAENVRLFSHFEKSLGGTNDKIYQEFKTLKDKFKEEVEKIKATKKSGTVKGETLERIVGFFLYCIITGVAFLFVILINNTYNYK